MWRLVRSFTLRLYVRVIVPNEGSKWRALRAAEYVRL